MQQCFGAHAKINFAAAAVNQKADTNRYAAVFFYNIQNFFYAAAGSNNIFNNQYAGAFRNLEAAFQSHFAVFTFGKNSAGAKRLAYFMCKQNAAGHRADNKLHIIGCIAFCQFLAKHFRIFGMLQHIEFFNVHRAVQTAGQ